MPKINFNFNQPGTPFVPFWRKCIAAGRAGEGLRDEWRRQLREVQRELKFEYIRFHGIFHEDMMIYREQDGRPVYNWQYLDSLFDFLLEIHLRPLLELSFMPYDLASGEAYCFWWKGNITPPKDYDRWADLVSATVRHCIQRYGLEEVLSWYFEVWNEPNLINGFWSGTQEEYFRLYAVTSRAIKAIDPRLRVGGPASSDSGGVRAPWVDEFIQFCAREKLPVDFISTHPYPNIYPPDMDGKPTMGYRDADSTLVDLQRIRRTVDASPFPGAEIHLTEWSSSPSPRDLVHDTAFMAPFVVMNNLKCLGLVDSLVFWTFTDVFEENRAGDTIFHGGFGLINGQGLKKASYYGYWFLSRLGPENLLAGPDYFVARKGERVQLLLWNYCHYTAAFSRGDRSVLSELDRYRAFQDPGPLEFDLQVEGLAGEYKVTSYTFDRQHGSVYDAWLACGAPPTPTPEELEWLGRQAGPDLKIAYFSGEGNFSRKVALPPHGVMLIEIQKI